MIRAVLGFGDDHTVVTGVDDAIRCVTGLYDLVLFGQVDAVPVHRNRVFIGVALPDGFDYFGGIVCGGVDRDDPAAEGHSIGVHGFQDALGLLVIGLRGHETGHEFTLGTADDRWFGLRR